MELTENERLMLVKKKETICGLTLKILDMAHDPKNALEIKKNLTTILSELNAIASYSDSKNYNLNQFTISVNSLFDLMWLEKEGKIWIASPKGIEYICNFANSIRFEFKKKFKIRIPKIDISLFRTG
jgi:hypothetical protein